MSNIDSARQWAEQWLKPVSNTSGARKRFRGDEITMGSPLRDDKNASFTINLNKRCWHDFATGEDGTLTELANLIGVEPPAYENNNYRTKAPERENTARPDAEKATRAAKNAAKDWASYRPATSEHPYLVAKGVQIPSRETDLRIDGAGCLVVPVYDIRTQKIQSLQRIAAGPSEAGKWDKRNYPDAPITGGVWFAKTGNKGEPFFLCEGVVTALSVASFLKEKEDMPGWVACTFGAENMKLATKRIIDAEGDVALFVASDDDTAGKTALADVKDLAAAQKMAAPYDLRPVFRTPAPPLSTDVESTLKGLTRKDEMHTDWNDVMQELGADKAKELFINKIKAVALVREAMKAAQNRTPDIQPASELKRASFRPLKWYISGLIPQGLTVLISEPKKGKSWLVFQAALHIAEGSNFLGREARKAPVLYAALEDSYARLKGRLQKLDIPITDGLEIATSFPPLDAGGLVYLAEWYAKNPGGLVILDVWAKVQQNNTERGGNAYEQDYKKAATAKALADKFNGGMLLVHHKRKGAGSAGDLIERASGSMGLPSAADMFLSLERSGEKDSANLERQGRDLDIRDGKPLPLTFGENGWRLATASELEERKREETEAELTGSAYDVMQVLKRAGSPLTAKEIYTQVKATTGEEVQENTIQQTLRRLTEAGTIERGGALRAYTYALRASERE